MNVTKENLRTFLGWCTVINLGFLLYWIIALVFAREWVLDSHFGGRDIERELCRNHSCHDGLLQTGGDSFKPDPVLGTQVRKVLPISRSGGVCGRAAFL